MRSLVKATQLVIVSVFLTGVGMHAANVYPEKYRFVNKETWEVPLATLPAGEYIIRVHDKLLNKEIFEVLGAKDGKVYCNFLAIPQTGMSGKETLTFWPGTTGPRAVRAWYIPSDGQAWEFVYPKERAVEIAKAAEQAIPAVDLSSMPTPNNPLLSSDNLRAVQLWLLTPKRVGQGSSADNVQIAAAKLVPEATTKARAAVRNHGVAPSETQHMPQTASNFLENIFAGALLFGSGIVLFRRSVRQV